ncbi:MAG: FtsX-like permease family protein, partial [Verrucomicrobia bacterium]|nr:FtsX-like permease family protein [Verrucomicrobiota bacterium]
MSFFLRHIVRYAALHRLLAAVNVLSIGLGVAVYLAIAIANESATKAFRAGVDVVSGKANLEARGSINDKLFPSLQHVPGVTAATPLVEGLVTLPEFGGEYLHLLGIDPFTNEAFRTFDGRSQFDADQWFSNPAAIVISKSFADLHGLKIGDRFWIRSGEKETQLVVSSILTLTESDRHLALMDIGWAQELLGMDGRLSEVLFRTSDPNLVIGRLRSLLPNNVLVQSPSQRSRQIEQLLAGFQLNLTALSMISLLVGVFLIYNTITASVVRRRNEVGIFRAIGATQSRVLWLFLGEACLYGILGSFAGVVGGVLLANFLVSIVSKTITNLYVLTSIEKFYIPADQLLVVIFLGIGSAFIGAWAPANAGAKMLPLRALSLVSDMRESARLGCRCLLLSGVSFGCAVLTGVAAFAADRSFGFASAFFLLTGFSLLSPYIVLGAGWFSARWSGGVFQLAAKNLTRSLDRNAMTVAALAASLAMLISISIMVFSFRTAVNHWVNQRLVADVFISPADNEIVGPEYFVSDELLAYLKNMPVVAQIDTFREVSVYINNSEVTLGVTPGTGRNLPDFVGGDSGEKYRQFYLQDRIIVSEPFARHFHLGAGDSVMLATPQGLHPFRIAGVFYDYTRDSGLMLMQQTNFEHFWHDQRVNSVALYLKPGYHAKDVIRSIERGFARSTRYSIRSNNDLKQLVSEIFNQTFAVTQVLRIVAVFISVIGIVLNLTVLVIEREKELGILRSLGFSQLRIGTLIISESLLIGGASLVLGVVAGCGLSIVLTEIINKAFFGWTIPLHFPWA